jgi:DNA-binding transcriptional ArsR family regulator
VITDRSAADSVAAARDAAVADALDEAARVLVRLAARLRAVHDGERAADRAAAPPPPTPKRPSRPAAQRQGLGERQMAVLALGGLADEHGLSAGEVAKVLGVAQSNATKLLNRLEELEYLIRVPDERPARWRRPTPTDG